MLVDRTTIAFWSSRAPTVKLDTEVLAAVREFSGMYGSTAYSLARDFTCMEDCSVPCPGCTVPSAGSGGKAPDVSIQPVGTQQASFPSSTITPTPSNSGTFGGIGGQVPTPPGLPMQPIGVCLYPSASEPQIVLENAIEGGGDPVQRNLFLLAMTFALAADYDDMAPADYQDPAMRLYKESGDWSDAMFPLLIGAAQGESAYASNVRIPSEPYDVGSPFGSCPNYIRPIVGIETVDKVNAALSGAQGAQMRDWLKAYRSKGHDPNASSKITDSGLLVKAPNGMAAYGRHLPIVAEWLLWGVSDPKLAEISIGVRQYYLRIQFSNDLERQRECYRWAVLGEASALRATFSREALNTTSPEQVITSTDRIRKWMIAWQTGSKANPAFIDAKVKAAEGAVPKYGPLLLAARSMISKMQVYWPSQNTAKKTWEG